MHHTPPLHESNNRLRVFDALRGFSMLSVVYMHILLGIGIGAEITISGAFVMTYFMPLFFFISGYFAFKPLDRWNKETLKRQFSQKSKALLLSSIIFYALLFYTRDKSIFGWVHEGFRNYWFTVALYQMFLIYFSTIVISKFIKKDLILILMLFLSGSLLLAREYFGLGNGDKCLVFDMFNTSETFFYLQYFVFGLFSRRLDSLFTKILLSEPIKTILIILTIASFCLLYSDYLGDHPALLRLTKRIIVPYIIVATFITLFYNFRAYFDKNSIIPNMMTLIGKRTLDIYMIHWFFLFPLANLKDFLMPNNMVTFQIVIGLSLSLIVITICLIVSNCLRSSKFLSEWLLGVRFNPQSLQE